MENDFSDVTTNKCIETDGNYENEFEDNDMTSVSKVTTST